MSPPHADTAPAPPTLAANVALAPEAASLPGAATPAQAAGTSGASQQAAAPAKLPRYVGRRRRLPPDAPLFEHANLERQLALQGTVMQVSAEEETALLAELAAPVAMQNKAAAAVAPVCSMCSATLPSTHLLSLHVAEVHDSFFAAQVARKLKVFQCLLETCERRFATAAERKQHLTDAHAFPKSFDFERMHMRSHKGQVRPAEPLQRFTPKPGRSYGQGGGRQAQQAGGRGSQSAGSSGPEQTEVDALADNLARKLGGLGRLPQQITFGRSRHHAPLRGRGRGGGRGGMGTARGRGRASVQLD